MRTTNDLSTDGSSTYVTLQENEQPHESHLFLPEEHLESLILQLVDNAERAGDDQTPHAVTVTVEGHFGKKKDISYQAGRITQDVYAITKNGVIHLIIFTNRGLFQKHIEKHHTVPVSLQKRTPAMIIMAALIQHGLYNAQAQDGTFTDKLQKMASLIANIDRFINSYDMAKDVNEQINALKIELNNLQALIPNLDAYKSLKEKLNKFIQELDRIAEKDNSSARSELRKILSPAFTKGSLLAFIKEFITEYLDKQTPSDHKEEAALNQLRKDLMKLALHPNYDSIPESQQKFIHALVKAPADQEGQEKFRYAISHPSTELVLQVLETIEGQNAHASSFLKRLLETSSILIARTLLGVTDIPFHLLQKIRKQQSLLFLSTQFENYLIQRAIKTQTGNSLLTTSMTTSSAEFVKLLEEFFSLENIKIAGSSLLQIPMTPYQSFLTSARSASLSNTNIKKLQDFWGKEPASFQESISSQIAESSLKKLRQHIETTSSSLYFLASSDEIKQSLAFYKDLFLNHLLNKEQLERMPPAEQVLRAALTEFLFEMFAKDSQENSTMLHPEDWKRGDIAGLTTFPLEITMLLEQLFLHFLVENPHPAKIAFITAIITTASSLTEVHQLAWIANGVAKFVMGKEVDGPASFVMASALMFKAGYTLMTVHKGEKSLIYELLDYLKVDPYRRGVPIILALTLAYGMGKQGYAEFIRVLSCDLNLSKTGVLFLPERFLKEIYEAWNLATWPYLEELFLSAKQGLFLKLIFEVNRLNTSEVLLPNDEAAKGQLIDLVIDFLIALSEDQPFNPSIQSEVSTIINRLNQLKQPHDGALAEPESSTTALPSITFSPHDTWLTMNFLKKYDLPTSKSTQILGLREIMREVDKSSLPEPDRRAIRQVVANLHVLRNKSTAYNFVYYALISSIRFPISGATHFIKNILSGKPTREGLKEFLVLATIGGYGVIKLLTNHTQEPTHCVDLSVCYGNHNDLDHEALHELVKECMPILTRCACAVTEGLWHQIPRVISTVGLVGGGVAAAGAGVIDGIYNYHQPEFQEERARWLRQLKQEGSNIAELLLGFLYGTFSYLGAAADSYVIPIFTSIYFTILEPLLNNSATDVDAEADFNEHPTEESCISTLRSHVSTAYQKTIQLPPPCQRSVDGAFTSLAEKRSSLFALPRPEITELEPVTKALQKLPSQEEQSLSINIS